MSDEISRMSAELAARPDSLVFLGLAEALRRRGQLEAALTIALGGAERYPALVEAHALVGRIRADRGEGDRAFDAWTEALRIDPCHLDALRGLAFLAYRAGDLARAERHLTAAVELAPEDPALSAALTRIREAQASGAGVPVPARGTPPDHPPTDSAPATDDLTGTLLVDQQGRRLAGLVLGSGGHDASDTVAAELAGVSREADRAVRLLGLGHWRLVTVESGDQQLHLVPPTPETLLLAIAHPGTPAGRSALQAERAAAAARAWLERMG